MAYVKTTTFLDADAMSQSLVKDEFDAARAWVNAIPQSDLPALEPVRKEHLYRPESYGFPSHLTKTDFQAMAGKAVFDRTPSADFVFDLPVALYGWWIRWADDAGRDTFFLERLANRPTDLASLPMHPVPGLIKRVIVPEASDMKADASYMAVQLDKDTGVSGKVYPAEVGFFHMGYKKPGDEEWTILAGTQRSLFPGLATIAVGEQIAPNAQTAFNQHMAVQNLPAGTYDIGVLFRQDTNHAAETNEQIIVTWQNLNIEVFRR